MKSNLWIRFTRGGGRLGAGIFLLSWLASAIGSRAQDADAFGKKDETGRAALMGMFYDLTQTQDGKPSGITTENYKQVLVDFIKNGWDEDGLSGYYRATKPLFTTQVWLPSMPTLEGPRAFGVEKKAPHAVWVIHYKGQIAPPEDGTYRFVGFGDDVLIVAINEKVVLSSSYAHLDLGVPPATPAGDCLKAGAWFDCQASKPVDLDILCCDNGDPGGVCASFVLIEEKGKTYQMNGAYPFLPIFQVAPYDTPDLPPGHYKAKFSHTPALWKAFQ
jgi:hypothetical protein